MSVGHRWKTFARAAKFGGVAVLALAVTPPPWLKAELPLPEQPATEDPIEAPVALEPEPEVDKHTLGVTYLWNELNLRKWKPGDATRQFLRAHPRLVAIQGMPVAEGLEVIQHGDYTTLRETTILSEKVPMLTEIAAKDGRLRAATYWYLVWSKEQSDLVPSEPSTFFFDTFSKDERAAYERSRDAALKAQAAVPAVAPTPRERKAP